MGIVLEEDCGNSRIWATLHCIRKGVRTLESPLSSPSSHGSPYLNPGLTKVSSWNLLGTFLQNGMTLTSRGYEELSSSLKNVGKKFGSWSNRCTLRCRGLSLTGQ